MSRYSHWVQKILAALGATFMLEACDGSIIEHKVGYCAEPSKFSEILATESEVSKTLATFEPVLERNLQDIENLYSYGKLSPEINTLDSRPLSEEEERLPVALREDGLAAQCSRALRYGIEDGILREPVNIYCKVGFLRDGHPDRQQYINPTWIAIMANDHSIRISRPDEIGLADRTVSYDERLGCEIWDVDRNLVSCEAAAVCKDWGDGLLHKINETYKRIRKIVYSN